MLVHVHGSDGCESLASSRLAASAADNCKKEAVTKLAASAAFAKGRLR